MRNKLLLLFYLVLKFTFSYAQVGIGTTTPKAYFNVIRGRTVLFGEDTNQVGSQNKLIWYASQGAFRVGGAVSTYWSRSSANDNTNVGAYSFASGYNVKASGYLSTAMGNGNIASGVAATALGNGNKATGDNSTAMGTFVSTNDQHGSFIIGDATIWSTLGNDASNQMMMRFQGGYKLFTNSNATIGVSLSSGGNAWQTLSDSTRKENFLAADGASFLQKISNMRLGSWNYKGQDAKQYRHYGPMAQEFFVAFGHDELGVIGEDKSINQADFDGVNLIAIQALIKKVEKLEADNDKLRAELKASRQDQPSTQELARKVARLEALLSTQLDTTAASLKP
ncbi:tail fiber domain-containing protein [Spirosoma validum]|uniref:Tail fiber domain-containing protein n=1 Tax=Spirosoma validum TaxID=2771355 RepID=A0A927GCK9_9BACT|nr:tail fiber domain-containing protein [Spirosoma validum]MBD2752635.1 tail fiber domain-containing protein [Spirosoma validum]